LTPYTRNLLNILLFAKLIGLLETEFIIAREAESAYIGTKLLPFQFEACPCLSLFAL